MKKLKNFTFLLAFIFLTISSLSAQEGRNKRTTNNSKTVKKSQKASVLKNGNRRVSSKSINYRRPTRKVVSQRVLPNNRSVIKHKGTNYYYANNRFYAYSRGRYVNIPPRVGFRIRNLPVGHIRVNHPNRNYFWFNGIFYISLNNEFEVVEPEIGTVVYQLPNQVERVQIQGYTYYEFANVLYERIQINGTRAYEVVGFIDQ